MGELPHISAACHLLMPAHRKITFIVDKGSQKAIQTFENSVNISICDIVCGGIVE
jgi:hypothetical protein